MKKNNLKQRNIIDIMRSYTGNKRLVLTAFSI